MMTQEEFVNFADTYGGNIDRWPEPLRINAKAFIKANPAIADPVLTEAIALDDALDSARIAPGTDMLKARILGAVDELPSTQVSKPAANQNAHQGLRYRAVAAMMAISFVLGFAGANYLQPITPEPGAAVVADNDWEELADDYGMSDVYEWTQQSPAP